MVVVTRGGGGGEGGGKRSRTRGFERGRPPIEGRVLWLGWFGTRGPPV